MRPQFRSKRNWSCWPRWPCDARSCWSTRVIWLIRPSPCRGRLVELKQQMLAMVGYSTVETESGMLTSLRQYEAVTATLEGLDAAGSAAAQNIPHEMVLLDLYGALRHLDSLTGETTTDDILNLIFSTFCIGK